MSRDGPTASVTGALSSTSRPPPASPTTPTFLFTDLEGSTRLWEESPDAMRDALRRHDAILAAAVAASDGQTVKTTGDGIMAVFGSVRGAVEACLDAQGRLAEEPWDETGPLRVRMGVHTGMAEVRDGDFFGPTVNRAQRIMAAGHGGQVLLSAAAAALLADQVPPGATLRDLGEHRLRSLGRPEHVFQVVHPALARDFPPLTTQRVGAAGLPAQTTTFVGRDAELAAIARRLRDGVRLLTLVGPGGTGKTRLALRAAADGAHRFAAGVVFTDLSAARDTDAVLTAIARAVALNETGDEPMLAQLARQLGDRRALIVLDNAEQVTDAATTLLELLQRCSGLTLLVTSREPLHVRGEHILPVPPLSLPDTLPRRPGAEQLASFEAIALFVARAQAVRADFRLTDANARAVAEICLRLDGLPLAIELATARIGLFSPETLRDRLGSSLQLRGGARDLPARQRTIRATIDWSYGLLDADEQRLLKLLSTFSGAGLEAVETVAGKVDVGTDPLDAIASLVDKSLVRVADSDGGEPRLAMLHTIREYAAERLHEDPELEAAARDAHAAYFAGFAQRQWDDLVGERREAALSAMSAETDNLRAAWRHGVARGDLAQLDRLVDSLWLLYDGRGWYQAAIELTTDLLELLSSMPPDPERAAQEAALRTSLARSLLAVKGAGPEVEEAYARALHVVEGHPELPQLFPVLRGLASFHMYRAEFAEGARVGREIVRLGERLHDRTTLAEGHLVLGYNLAFSDDLRGGLRHLDEGISCLDPARHRSPRFRVGPNPGVVCLASSALVLWMLGAPDRAVERADAGIALAERLGQPFTTAYALFHAGLLHLWRREPDVVRARAAGVLDVVDEHDFPIWRAVATCLDGAAGAAAGDPHEGLGRIAEGMEMYRGLRTPPVFWPLLLRLHAGACADAGRTDEGLRLIDEALDVAGRGAGRTLRPELELQRGDLLVGAGAGEHAEPCFARAFELARELHALMPQMRAATRLCRLARPRDDAQQRRQMLRQVRSAVTEGLTTADVRDADAALAALSA